MPTTIDPVEERLRELARRVASASRMSYEHARRAILSCAANYGLVITDTDTIKSQLDKIHQHVHKQHRGRNSGWFSLSPERRELVTRRGPRLLIVTSKTDSRRYRRISKKKRHSKQRKNTTCPQ